MLDPLITSSHVHNSEAARHSSSSRTILDHLVPYHGYEIPRGLDAAITVSGTKIKAWLDGKPCHSACEFAALVDAKRTELVNWLGETVQQSCSLVGKWTRASGRSAPSFIALLKVDRDIVELIGSTLFEQEAFCHRFYTDGEISFTPIHATQDLQAALHRKALLQYNHAETTRGRQYATDCEGYLWAPAVHDSALPTVISRHDTVLTDLQKLLACSPSKAIDSGHSGCSSIVPTPMKGSFAINHHHRHSFTHPV